MNSPFLNAVYLGSATIPATPETTNAFPLLEEHERLELRAEPFRTFGMGWVVPRDRLLAYELLNGRTENHTGEVQIDFHQTDHEYTHPIFGKMSSLSPYDFRHAFIDGKVRHMSIRQVLAVADMILDDRLRLILPGGEMPGEVDRSKGVFFAFRTRDWRLAHGYFHPTKRYIRFFKVWEDRLMPRLMAGRTLMSIAIA